MCNFDWLDIIRFVLENEIENVRMNLIFENLCLILSEQISSSIMARKNILFM
jgi:hypothetical protein